MSVCKLHSHMCNGSRLLHFFENCGRVATLRKPLVLVAIFMTLLAEIGAYLITKWHFSLLPDDLVNHLFWVLFVKMSLYSIRIQTYSKVVHATPVNCPTI